MNGNMIKVKANEMQLNYIYILFFKLKWLNINNVQWKPIVLRYMLGDVRIIP